MPPIGACGFKRSASKGAKQGGGKTDFVVPAPDIEPLPKQILHYLSSQWACGHISLFVFLPKTYNEGAIVDWLRKGHESSDSELGLEHFAAVHRMQGQRVIAAMMGSRLLSLYGQWLLLHVPWTNPTQFVDEDVLNRVPPEHRYCTMAITCGDPHAKTMWNDDEGHTTTHAQSILSMVHSTRALVQDYLSGVLDVQQERARREIAEQTQDGSIDLHNVVLNPEQIHVDQKALEFLSTAITAQFSEDEAVAERAQEFLRVHNRIIAAFTVGILGASAALNPDTYECGWME